ncbi:MAG TPA: glycosyltransferase family 1 protein [Myxococcaceae bacterium]|nr:glycosyltransferase family 1 protein [Myxococcaceae bacterium]
MPRVVIDLRMVTGGLHGIARYALELARRLPALRPHWDWVGLTGPQGLPGDLGPLLAPSLPTLRCRAGFLSPWEQPALLASLASIRPDLFHATSFSLPALWPGRLLATLHDANHLALPQYYGRAQRAYYRWVVAPRAARAEGLLTVSEFSRGELARHLRLEPSRFHVTPLGVSDAFRPPAPSKVSAFRRRRGLPDRYFAAVGNPKPHKNLGLLGRIGPRLPAPIALLAGAGTATKLCFPPTTIDLGTLPEAEMPLYYGGAVALLVPSLYEGFGLPALEAMASACPVVAARAGALQEWVSGAGTVLDPRDEGAWVSACQRAFEDPGARASWIEQGRIRAEKFTWEACAEQTAARYERALD